MNRAVLLFLVSALPPLSACQGLNRDPGVPAVIVDPDEASRAALGKTLSKVFAGQEITLADDALTQSSILVLQHNPGDQQESQAALGRVVDEPIRFQLVKTGDGCFLVDLRDERRYLLANTSCVAE